MEKPDYDSPAGLRKFLESRGFAMQRRFGQNFLVNRSAREKIVSLLDLEKGEDVWEIGPGLGAMTEILLEAGACLSAFEIDHGFIDILIAVFSGQGNIEIVQGDVMKTWKGRLAEKGPPSKVFGNLPYNISGAILADFAENRLESKKMVFTLQKEAAERIRAQVSSKEYSSFSVLCQSVYKISAALDLRPGSFWPAPEVTSTVVVMEPRIGFPEFRDRKLFLRLLRVIFSSRRKTMRNNLKAGGFPSEAFLGALDENGISPDARAETLSPEKIAEFANSLSLRLE